jgi:hypothetical protein
MIRTFHLQTRQQQMSDHGGGGGGGRRRSDEPPPYNPRDLARILRQLGAASGELFSSETRFLITEESAHDLLTGTLEALAVAAERGQLRDIVEKIGKRASEQRSIATHRISDTAKSWQNLPVFTEVEGRDIVKKISDCLVPRIPN